MAGGPSTPRLAAAVSGAGGLGFLAAGYRPAQAVRADIRWMRDAREHAFGVNLFVPGTREADHAALQGYVRGLDAEAAR